MSWPRPCAPHLHHAHQTNHHPGLQIVLLPPRPHAHAHPLTVPSYKDQTEIEPFSPKCNVIVGHNGSGKSNFFAAVRFVLSDAYTQMNRQERQALLHEGSGSAVLSAYVEIIFDNSDERFPTGRDEVVLRRTIGLQKDEYTLDHKHASKNDVMNLLESAGFSRSNPYYIVPQGRVTMLTNMKDSERLLLLKEVAGTQVYEQRRTESLKIMNDTDNKRTKIDELLKYIEERLGELEEEKEELRGYHEKDRERRCLEYTIYHREQVEIVAALEKLEEQRQRGSEMNEDAQEAYDERERNINELEKTISTTKQEAELLLQDKRQLEDERKQHVKHRAQLELDAKALTDDQDQLEQAKERYEQEMAEIVEAIAERERELEELTPEYNEIKQKEHELRSELEEADATRQRLYAKQGRNTKFRTKKERDEWLKKEIEVCQVNLEKRENAKARLEKEVAEAEKNADRLDEEIESIRARLDGRNAAMEEIQDEVAAKKDIRDKLMDERKELWREEGKLDAVAETSRKELEQAEHLLSSSMDNNTARGLKAVARIKERLKLKGCYGTLAELMDVPDAFRTAVEVTAGQSLFHYVVDNDETATRVLEQLQKEKGGRITFMPLNRLNPRLATFPNAGDALAMHTKIEYDDQFQKAIHQVFGKTIICPDLNVASQYARSHGVNAITLAGDRADKKGALTGGYHDPRRSRLEAVKAAKKWREVYEEQLAQSQEIKRAVEQKDQEITNAVSELQKAQARQTQSSGQYGPLRHNLQGLVSSVAQLRDSITRKQDALQTATTDLKTLSEQLAAYQGELSTEFKKKLTAAEESQLESLAARCQELRRELSGATNERAQKESRKSILTVELRENLHMRLDALKASSHDLLETTTTTGRPSTLRETQRELTRITALITSLTERLTEAEESLTATQRTLSNLTLQIQELQSQQAAETAQMARQKKRIEKSMSKRSLFLEKSVECSRNIRDLGVIPDEAFERYTEISSDQIVRSLHKVNDALRGFSHVNKKAFEQYSNFTKQRDTLTTRREELDTSQTSIADLIQHLDQRKDEAIDRTFRQVSKSFADIFSRLVPAGKGRLIIQRRAAEDTSVESYTGVAIKVSFNSHHDEQQMIGQLSGGQKSLCALALIFAIQQCDPAPFYLFDEVDANLDAQYRAAVAQMVKTLAAERENGQFICTTFRPELVHVADKQYGVLYKDKTSSVKLVEKKEALRFVEEQRPDARGA